MSYLNNLTHNSIKSIYTLKHKHRVPNSDAVMILPYITTLLSYLSGVLQSVNTEPLVSQFISHVYQRPLKKFN